MSKVIIRLPGKTLLIDTKAVIEVNDFFVTELHSDDEIPSRVHQYTEEDKTNNFDPNDLEEFGYYKILASTEFIDASIDLLVL